VYYQICIIYYVPPIHDIYQDKMQQLLLGYIWLRPKHVAKYNLSVIVVSCLDVCCVLTVLSNLYNILCTANTRHTSRQDATITIRLYLATAETCSQI
jgi:hypothetical protein